MDRMEWGKMWHKGKNDIKFVVKNTTKSLSQVWHWLSKFG